MHRTIVLAVCCFVAASAAPRTPARIVGGSVTTIEQYPWTAALLYSSDLKTYTQLCSGSILNSRSVLSTAHCISGDAANHWRIRVGSTFANSGGVVHNIAEYIIHPSYNSHNLDNDIAIVRTATTITYNDNVRPVSIAGPNYNIADDQIVWADGWGSTSDGSLSEQLRHVQVRTINQGICNILYGGAITANMLCTGSFNSGGQNLYPGNSGGLLHVNGVLVGIISWESEYRDFHPGVNARVSRVSNWILENAENVTIFDEQ